MAVLTTTKVWRRPETIPRRSRAELTPDECDNVKRALRFLRVRFGGYAALAEAMGVRRVRIQTVASKSGRPGVAFAFALAMARAAKVPVEDVLRGGWPKSGCCPMCGRCGPP